jgi:hypothetical protein
VKEGDFGSGLSIDLFRSSERSEPISWCVAGGTMENKDTALPARSHQPD